MKILVTGGAGFIGSHIVDSLILNSNEVAVIDNLSGGKEKNINKHAKFYKIDIRDSQIGAIFREEKPKIVIHNAAQISVRTSVEDPVFDADVNILGSLNIIKACAEANVEKIIFASSGGTVYGEQKSFPADEEHPLFPVSPYGVAKLSVEKYLYYYFYNFGLKYISLRYANIYGPRQDPYGEAGVVAIFSNKMLKGENPVINGDGKQTRDYLYVKDAVEANILAIKSDFVGEVNIGTSRETEVITIFSILKNASGKKDIKEIHGPPKKGEQKRSSLSYEKAEMILGWKPKVSLEEGLNLTYNWFEENDNV